MRLGERPEARDLTLPLTNMSAFFEAHAAETTLRHDLLSAIAGAVEPAATITSKATTGLLQLGDSYLLPLSVGTQQKPVDVVLKTNGVLGNHLEVRYNSGSFGFIGNGWRLSSLWDVDEVNGIEIEAYQLDAETLRRTRGYGFSSSEGIDWLLTPGEPLKAELTITVPPGTHQYLYLDAPKHMPPPLIERIAVDDDVRYANILLRGGIVVPLPGEYSQITITLSQSIGYPTTIGHSYAYEALTASGEVFGPDDARRIPGPYPSLAAYGAVQGSDRRVEWAAASLQPTLVNTERGSEPVEILRADRYVIALSEIALVSGNFSTTGDLIIGPITWAQTPARVRLNANVMVPPSWIDGNYVQFWISANRQDWSPISPDGVNQPRTYVIGTIPIQEETPVIAAKDGQFWVRTRLSRPSDDATRTPIVSNLSLVGED